MAYGNYQATGWIRVVAAGLSHSHSNARPEPHLWHTLQFMAMQDPLIHWVRQRLSLHSHIHKSGSLPLSHNGNSQILLVLIADIFYTVLNCIAIFTIFSLPIHEHGLSFHLFVSLIFFINIIYFHQWRIFFSVQYFNSLLNLFLIIFMILKIGLFS